MENINYELGELTPEERNSMENLGINPDNPFGIDNAAADEATAEDIGAEDAALADPQPEDTAAEQTHEERAAHAEARRNGDHTQHEVIRRAIDAAAARAAAQERERQQVARDALVASMNLIDPDTNQPIKTENDFKAYQIKKREKTLEEQLSFGELKPDVLKEIIDAQVAQQPDVIEAKRVAAMFRQQQQQVAAQQAQIRAQAFEQQARAEIAQIAAYDANIKGVEDLRSLDRFPQFQDYVARGLNFVDAYELTYKDRIIEQAAKRAASSAAKNAKSTSHMKPVVSSGGGSRALSGQELDIFRAMYPGKSDAELQKLYDAANKHGG